MILPPQNQPRLLTPDQERIIREAWAAGIRRDDVCRMAGVSLHVFEARRKDQLANLPPRPRGVGGRYRCPLPSPVEIKLAAHEARQRWSEERWLGLDPLPDPPLGMSAAPPAGSHR